MNASIEVQSSDTETEFDSVAYVDPDSTAPLSKIGLKAGMQGLDKAKVNQIIFEATKGSKFHESELRKDEQIEKKIKSMMVKLEEVTDVQKTTSLKVVDREIESLEKSRDLSHVIIHVDMDAFYASVEMRDNPKLKNLPMAVGSTGMLSTSNYLARQYGVRAAMPGFIGKKLCPELIIVKPNYQKYRQISSDIQDVLAVYDPHFSSAGLDEAYLDLTAYIESKLTHASVGSEEPQRHPGKNETANFGGEDDGESEQRGVVQLPLSYWECAEAVVEEIRHEIFKKIGLTASAGIAPNKMLAKVASDINKPNGQYLVTPTREGVLNFVQKLPIRKIVGIGKVTERMLNALGVMTCADLYQKRAILHLLFSPVSMQSFLCICLGIGSAKVFSEYERKSISTERTFSETSSPEELQRKCYELCESLSKDVLKQGMTGRTVTLKIKTVDFEVKTRGCTLPHPLSTADEIYNTASELLRLEIRARSPKLLRLRLMGVRLSALESSKAGCKQGTLTELLKQCTGGSSSVKAPEIQQCEESDSESSYGGDMATCPVCNQLVPAENTVFNQHIDECLNCSVIQEDSNVSIDSIHQESVGESHSKASLNLRRDEGHCRLPKSVSAGSSSSNSVQSRKRKAVSDPNTSMTRNKKRTLDYYFSNQRI